MAKMIPDGYPPDTPSNAERQLFDIFRTALPNDYVVFHSLKWVRDNQKGMKEGECDFLVLHPENGMLAIEVKGGDVRFENGCWFQNNHKVQDPFDQAQRCVHHLNEELNERIHDFSVPFGHAVAFPEARKRDGELPLEATRDIIMLHEDTLQPKRWVDKTLARYRKSTGKLSDQTFQQVLDVIRPRCRFIPSLRATVEREKRQLAHLSDDQMRVLDMLRNCRKAIVEGCSGSGKTMLAIEKTERLLEKNYDVLFLCYNNPLYRYLQRNVNPHDNLLLMNFHTLCRHVLQEVGRPVHIPDDAPREFWNAELPSAFIEAIEKWPRQFDALIVDEAQDFREEWWLPLWELLRNDEDGILYAFRDVHQNIFSRKPVLPFDAQVYPLSVNCRNSAAIAREAQRLGGFEESVDKDEPEGRQPEHHSVTSDREERDCVRKLLHHLINEEGIPAEEVVILGQHKLQHSIFAEERKLGNFQITDDLSPENKNAIRYSTIYRFKGLEADAVILLSLHPSENVDADEIPELRYVGASRARSILRIIDRDSSKDRTQ